MNRRNRPATVLATLMMITLASCQTTSPPTVEPAGDGASPGFPVTITNCGTEVELAAAPERIFLINTDDIPLLAALDALDLVVARTSEPVEGVYSAEVQAGVDRIKLVAADTGATGGSVISIESILAENPDLVLAPENAADRQALADAGVALYSSPAYCEGETAGETATFESVYDQVRAFGTMLGRQNLAEQRVAELEAKLTEPPALTRTGVALYVPAGGGTLYPYGAPSMVTPVFAAAGLANAYADATERVFEVNLEDLLSRDPEVVVLLYSSGTPDAAIENFRGVAGVDGLTAVKENRIATLQFPFTDPPTPLSIEGVSRLQDALAELP